MNLSVDPVFLFNCINIFISNVFEGRDRVIQTTGFITLSPKLNPASMFKLVNLLRPVLLIHSLSKRVHLGHSVFHGIARLKSLLDLILSVIVQHLCFLLKEYAEHESIYYEPAVAPEKTEQPLNLVEWDDLSKNAHDPVLAKYHDID